jgi:hypothetical protein
MFSRALEPPSRSRRKPVNECGEMLSRPWRMMRPAIIRPSGYKRAPRLQEVGTTSRRASWCGRPSRGGRLKREPGNMGPAMIAHELLPAPRARGGEILGSSNDTLRWQTADSPSSARKARARAQTPARPVRWFELVAMVSTDFAPSEQRHLHRAAPRTARSCACPRSMTRRPIVYPTCLLVPGGQRPVPSARWRADR